MILSLLISSEISSRVHISSALKKMPSKIISDGNRSALNFAQEHGIPIEVYHAVKNYDRLFEDSCVNSERASLQERNRRMSHDSDCLLCFSEKDDYYIHSAIEYAKSMGKPYKLVMCRNLYALPIGWKLRIFHNLDSNMTIRYSHENQDVKELYNDLLQNPLSHKSEELLHVSH